MITFNQFPVGGYRKKTTGVTIIPASGIGVYNIKPVHKLNYIKNSTWSGDLEIGRIYYEQVVNTQYTEGVANIKISIDQLKKHLPNCRWVALVIGWFLDFNTKECVPMVEIKRKEVFESINVDGEEHYRTVLKDVIVDDDEYKLKVKEKTVSYGEESVTFLAVTSDLDDYWKVGSWTRENARLISDGLYGETPSDKEVIDAINFFKSQGFKVCFYPFLFGYDTDKPWRGRLHFNYADEVNDFMSKDNGFNNFIKHYVDLLSTHNVEVDAFLVGSEMRGLTMSAPPTFPAVQHLIDLVMYTKQKLPNTKVSYAADWSEYHSDYATGIRHLDRLWKYCDMVCIDAYFPLTESHTENFYEIYNGWTSGEHYDWVYRDAENGDFTKIPISPQYAWKNLKFWWENEHYNPDGTKTDWIPRSKKIWFSELGFSCVHSATVQPNIFVDTTSVEGGYPRGSTKETNFVVQSIALDASLEFLQKQEWLEEVFIWTWDARPYPVFPHDPFWTDGVNWEKGHWVNGKFVSDETMYIVEQA